MRRRRSRAHAFSPRRSQRSRSRQTLSRPTCDRSSVAKQRADPLNSRHRAAANGGERTRHDLDLLADPRVIRPHTRASNARMSGPNPSGLARLRRGTPEFQSIELRCWRLRRFRADRRQRRAVRFGGTRNVQRTVGVRANLRSSVASGADSASASATYQAS